MLPRWEDGFTAGQTVQGVSVATTRGMPVVSGAFHFKGTRMPVRCQATKHGRDACIGG